MLNRQPREKPDRRNDGTLDIVSVWETIQGEGPYAGMPAVFMRLAGCNLDCPGCDTDYISGRHRVPIAEAARLASNVRKSGLVVFTGGEPFRQPIGPLAALLAESGRLVQIETNGSLYPGDDFPFQLVSIVCSPKAGIDFRLGERVAAWKYVLQAGAVDQQDGLPTSVLGLPCRPGRPENNAEVFVQPMDEQDPEANKRNLSAAIESCMRYGYRLSIQMHKIAGLP